MIQAADGYGPMLHGVSAATLEDLAELSDPGVALPCGWTRTRVGLRHRTGWSVAQNGATRMFYVTDPAGKTVRRTFIALAGGIRFAASRLGE